MSASLTLGDGLVETCGVNTDYHVTSVEVAPARGPALINHALPAPASGRRCGPPSAPPSPSPARPPTTPASPANGSRSKTASIITGTDITIHQQGDISSQIRQGSQPSSATGQASMLT